METAVGVPAGSIPPAGSMPPASNVATRAETSDVELNRATDPHSSLIGATLVGRYQVIRKIGQGGMGAVYEALHLSIGKRVAVKVLLEKFAKREAIIARLEQEAGWPPPFATSTSSTSTILVIPKTVKHLW